MTIQSQHYDFITIKDIATMEPRKTVDILAVVEAHEPMTEFRSRKGREMKKKQLTIVDSTNNVGGNGEWGMSELLMNR